MLDPIIAVFLGSGASAFAGYRTFQTFGDLILKADVREADRCPEISDTTPILLEEARKELAHRRKPATHDNYLWVLNEYKQFCKIFESYKSIRQRNPTHFQALWETLGPFHGEVETAISDLTATTLHHYSKPRISRDPTRGNVQQCREVASFYTRLAIRNNPDKPYLPIFTTNYDLLLEDIFMDQETKPKEVRILNGIPSLASEGAPWNPLPYKPASPGVHLYRVHGCVCWHKIDNVVRFHRRDAIQQQSDGLCVMFPGREICKGDSPHSFSFHSLWRVLCVCRLVVFIGFSFRDDDVMHILLAANATRPERPIKVLTVDPSMTGYDVHQQFRSSATRCQFPVAVPDSLDIKHRELYFGSGNFNDIITSDIEILLKTTT